MVLAEIVDPFLEKHRVYDRLPVCSQDLCEYLTLVESQYNEDLPYHNIDHVCDVLSACVRLWEDAGLGEIVAAACPSDAHLLTLAFVVAAAVHDVGHQGLTNDFLIRSHHPYAIDFNDASPNESHHSSTAFKILFNQCNFLSHLPAEKVWLFRQTVITLVMGTDMARHHGIVSNLCSRDFARIGSSELPVVMQAALKCADLSHVFKPSQDHVHWSMRLQEEMFAEGDLWKKHGWTPPSLMDRRSSSDFATSQIGFFRYVVIPFMEALSAVLPQTAEHLAAAKRNEELWQRRS